MRINLLFIYFFLISCSNVDNQYQVAVDSLENELYDAHEKIEVREREIKLNNLLLEKERNKVDSLRREIDILKHNNNINEGDPAIISLYQMHGDEFQEAYRKISWLGLFKSNSSFYIEPAEVRFENVHDVIVDEKGEETGVKPILNSKDSALFLLSHPSIKIDENLQDAGIDNEKEITESAPLEINFSGKEYFLSVRSDKKNMDGRAITSLYLSAGYEEQLIITHEHMSDKNFSVLWAGDLNGDRQLDLILDISNHYNVFKPALYLSTPDDSQKFVELIASQSLIGC